MVSLIYTTTNFNVKPALMCTRGARFVNYKSVMSVGWGEGVSYEIDVLSIVVFDPKAHEYFLTLTQFKNLNDLSVVSRHIQASVQRFYDETKITNIKFTSVLLNQNKQPWKSELKDIQEFRDTLAALTASRLNKQDSGYDITKDLGNKIELQRRFPGLKALNRVVDTNQAIEDLDFKNVKRGDVYFYIALGIHDILISRYYDDQLRQEKLEKFTFQAHIRHVDNDPSLNYTGETAKHLENIGNFLVVRLGQLKDQLNDEALEGSYQLFKLIFDNLSVETIANLLVSWSLDFYKTSFYEEGVESLRSTQQHFTLGRLMYKRALNVGKDNFGKDKTFTQFLESLDPIHEKIYEKVTDDTTNYDQLTSVVGSQLIDLLRRAQVLEQRKQRLDNKEYYYLTISSKFKNKVSVANMTSAKIPTTFPMVCPPKVWEYKEDNKVTRYGGYLWNNVHGRSTIWYGKEHYSNPSEVLVSKDGNSFIDLINGLSSTPFRINKEVLDFIIDNNNKLNIFNNSADDIKDKRKRDKARIDFTTLVLACVYSYSNVIYLPVKADFRTRIYSDVYALSYQGSDLSRGLLEFYTPGKLSRTDALGILMLKSMGPSLFSKRLAKLSLIEKAHWVDVHKEEILNFKNLDSGFLHKCNKKKLATFIAWCFEYSRLVAWENSDTPQPFYTHYPIQLDATCSGLQHLVMLIRDSSSMLLLNLSNIHWNDKPNDLYAFAVSSINSIMKKDVVKKAKSKKPEVQQLLDSYRRLIAFDLDRDVIKNALMTYNYNASKITMADYIELKLASIAGIIVKYFYLDEDENLVEVTKDYKCKKGQRPVKSFTNNYSTICSTDILVYVSLFDVFYKTKIPGVVALKEYLSKMGAIFAELNLPIPWKLPSGILIQSGYKTSEPLRYEPIGGERKGYNFRGVSKTFDKRKMRNSLMPNFIHSLDGCAIALLYKHILKTLDTNGEFNLYTIHDCFGITAELTELLLESIRQAYIELYFNCNYLEDFDKSLLETLRNQLGESTYVNDCHVYNIYNSKLKKYIKFEIPDIKKVLKYTKYFESDLLKDSNYIVTT